MIFQKGNTFISRGWKCGRFAYLAVMWHFSRKNQLGSFEKCFDHLLGLTVLGRVFALLADSTKIHLGPLISYLWSTTRLTFQTVNHQIYIANNKKKLKKKKTLSTNFACLSLLTTQKLDLYLFIYEKYNKSFLWRSRWSNVSHTLLMLTPLNVFLSIQIEKVSVYTAVYILLLFEVQTEKLPCGLTNWQKSKNHRLMDTGRQ